MAKSKQVLNREYYSRNRAWISTKMAARARQNRADAEAAAGGRCVKCGGTEKLQFDHIDCTQKSSHKIWTWSAARRQAELDKCQLLCERCHIQKTIDAGEHQWRTRPWD